MKGFLSRWGPALVLMAVIFAASATPGEDLPNAGDWDTVFKKGGHLLGYALLGVAYLRGLAGSRTCSATPSWAWPTCAASPGAVAPP